MPEWVLDLSAPSHPTQLTTEQLTVLPLLVLVALTVAGTAAGLVGLRRRLVANTD